MATTRYFWPLDGACFLGPTAPTLADATVYGTTTAGATEDPISVWAGGSSADTWYSQVLAEPFTLFGLLTISVSAYESNMGANAGLTAYVYRYRPSTFTFTQIGSAADGVELSTSATVMSWDVALTSTAFLAGDRVCVRFFATQQGGTKAAGYQVNIVTGATSQGTGVFSSTVPFTDFIGTGSNTVAAMTSAGTGTRTGGSSNYGANTVADFTSAATGEVLFNEGLGASVVDAFTSQATGTVATDLHAGTGGNNVSVVAAAQGVNTLPAFTERTILAGSVDSAGVKMLSCGFVGFPDYVTGALSSALADYAYFGGATYSSTHGYISGRYDRLTSQTHNNALRVDLRTEAWSTLASGVVDLDLESGSWDLSDRGYTVGGGYSGTDRSTNIRKVTYATEVYATVAAVLGLGVRLPGCVQSGTTGYALGASNNGETAEKFISGMTFATEAADTVAATLPLRVYLPVAVYASAAGYTCDSQRATDAGYSGGAVYKFTYATEAVTTPAGTLAAKAEGAQRAKSSHASVGGIYRGGVAYDNLLIYTFGTETFATHVDRFIAPAMSSVAIKHASFVTLATGTGANTTAMTSAATAVVDVFGDHPGTGANTTEAIGQAAIGWIMREGAGANTLAAFTSLATYPLDGWVFLCGGGGSGTGTSDIRQFFFDTEVVRLTTSLLPYPATRVAESGGFASASKGYVAGGADWANGAKPPVASYFALDKFTALSTTLSAVLSAATTETQATSNSATKGYCFGGDTVGDGVAYSTTIQGLNFGDETAGTPAAVLPAAARYVGAANAPTAAFVFSSNNQGCKFLYATETASTYTTAVPYVYEGVMNAAHAGFVVGVASQTQRLDFNTETLTPLAVSIGDLYPATPSPRMLSGKSAGYATGSNTSRSRKYTYASGTLQEIVFRGGNIGGASLGASVHFTDYVVKGVGASTVADVVPWTGPVGGGAITLDNVATVCSGRVAAHPGYAYLVGADNKWDKFNFLTEVAVTSTKTFTGPTNFGAGVSSLATGYLCGGQFTGVEDYINTVTFATDAIGLNSGVLSTPRTWSAGAQAEAKGYIAAGSSNTTDQLNSIDGLTFSTGAVAVLAATAGTARYGLAGMQSDARAYFGGGNVAGLATTEVSGIRFDTEAAVTPAVALTAARQGPCGASTSHKGFWMGGEASGAFSAEIDGILFSTESTINPAATLLYGRYFTTGVASFANAYACGGNVPSAVQEIDGINFNTEAAINPAATLRSGHGGGSHGVYHRTDKYFGDSAKTLAAFVQSASGYRTDFAGTGANTLDAFTTAGAGVTGLAGRSGTGANTTDALTSAGSGIAAHTGTGANTTVAGSTGEGVVIPRSTGTGSNSAMVSSTGSGVVGVGGAASTGIETTSSGGGTVSITGMGDSAFTAFMQVATGGVRIVGAATPVTAGSVTCAGWGYVTDFTPASHAAKMDGVSASANAADVAARTSPDDLVASA